MRSKASFIGLVWLVGGIAGCGGGGASNHCFPGDPQCGQLSVEHFVESIPRWQTPDAPIPFGTSVNVSFHEQRCVTSGQRGSSPPGTGCDPWYVPNTLVATVFQMASPLGGTITCPVTVTQIASGTLRFTRTAPGDPTFGAGNAGAHGYCNISVADPATNSFSYNIIL